MHHLGTRQKGHCRCWVKEIDLDPAAYGTHSIRRTKASRIYWRTRNLRAVQLLLGHTKLEGTVRYLGIEVDGALQIAEQTEVEHSRVAPSMATVGGSHITFQTLLSAIRLLLIMAVVA
jgi:hypothetical protein